MFSRDNNLDNAYILYTETLQHTPLYLSICGSYLLVYTTENVLNIYNIVTRSENPNAAVAAAMNGNGTANVARIERVRRIALGNVIARVTRVRGISLFSNHAGGKMGIRTAKRGWWQELKKDERSNNDAAWPDKCKHCTTRGWQAYFPQSPYTSKYHMHFWISWQPLISICKDDDDDSDLTGQPYTQAQYELNVLSDKIEYYWIGRKNVANLCTSLWAVNGHGIKVTPGHCHMLVYDIHQMIVKGLCKLASQWRVWIQCNFEWYTGKWTNDTNNAEFTSSEGDFGATVLFRLPYRSRACIAFYVCRWDGRLFALAHPKPETARWRNYLYPTGLLSTL